MGNEKEGMLQKAYELGFTNERDYRGCSQSTLAAIQDVLGKRDDAVFKAATGLAGGLGATGAGTCGAVTGAALAIGSQIGRERDNFKDPERIRSKTFALVRQLCDRFNAEYGGINCDDIQMKLFGRVFNFNDPVEYQQFDAAGGHTTKCTGVCGNAAKWAVEILLQQ